MAASVFAAGFQAKPRWWEAAEPAAPALRRLGHAPVVLDVERVGWGASNEPVALDRLRDRLDRMAA